MRGRQRRFNSFRKELNKDRPYEAIGQPPPASVYVPSPPVYFGDREDHRPYRGHGER